MFPTFPKPLRAGLSGLAAGFALAVLAPLAAAQTMAEIHGLMKRGEMPRALERVERYIAARPKEPDGPFAKGLILAELGRPREAIAVFSEMTERFPGLPEPYNNLAVLYAGQKEYEKARAALEMAIRTHPSYAVAHQNLGGIYAKLASQAYDKALQLDASSQAAPARLAMIGEIAPAARPALPAPRPEPPTAVALADSPKPPPAVSPSPAVPPPVAAASPGVSPSPAAGLPSPKPAEAKPAETKPPGAPAPADAAGAVAGTVREWAAAWSRKDVPAYLAFYAAEFQTPNGLPRAKWEAERRARIDKPGRLQVNVDDIKVSAAGDKATARFRQRYASATLKTQAVKSLAFVKSGERWLIVQERIN